jgi:hypothetical protein
VCVVGESSGCSGYASKAFLVGVGTSASPLTPASATPSLTTIKSQGQERPVSGLSDGEKRRASDARQIEDSDNAFGPTTLMGRLKVSHTTPSVSPVWCSFLSWYGVILRQHADPSLPFFFVTLLSQAAAAMQQHRPKKKRRSLMDNPRDSLAGYSVRDMQRNEHMRVRRPLLLPFFAACPGEASWGGGLHWHVAIIQNAHQITG